MRLGDQVVALLDGGAVLVTANARAARALRLRHADLQVERGLTVWSAPRIFDCDAWLSSLWRDLLLTGTEPRLLLSPLQEAAIWARIITPPVRQQSLLAPEGVAALAQEAYALLCAFNALPHLGGTPWGSTDSEAELFRRWARSFSAECASRGWLAPALLPQAIAQAFESRVLAPPPLLGWMGFDRTTPAQQALLEAAAAAGCACTVIPAEQAYPAEAVLQSAGDLRSEAATCATWIRSKLDAQPGSSLRIGVIVPDVAAARAEIEHEFRRVLAPESVAISGGPAPPPPFEFSLGLPLSDVPLVAAALLLLRWLSRPLPQAEITWLLLSGFLIRETDADARHSVLQALAAWDVKARDRRVPAPLEADLERWLHRDRPNDPVCGKLAARLRSAKQQFSAGPALRTHSEWAALTRELLAAGGWRAAQGADSVSFQAYHAWDRALDDLASIDLLGARVEFAAFLKSLERLAAQTIFSPESHDAPVQVMGPFESSGQSFDALWFMGANDNAWPASGVLNPLLPAWLSRELGLPHASPQDDFALASRATERLLHSAPEVRFSYVSAEAGAKARPSGLLRHLPCSPVEEATAPAREDVTESFEEAAAIPWPMLRAAGGQDVLQHQAACPFRAFAIKRLGAQPLDSASHGLSPLQRGTVLHDVLQRVWSKQADEIPCLGSRADLINAEAEGHLLPLVQRHAAAALAKFRAAAAQPWEHAYIAQEEQRIIALTMEWLAYERGRVDFKVAHCESKLDVDIDGLKLQVRADRVDSVPGGHLLIDYKTGKVTPAKWEGDRPEEPQLPLYTVFGGIENVIGAVFAQVRAGDLEFFGRMEAAESNLRPGLGGNAKLMREPYTQQVHDDWERVLRALSASFLRGDAQVDPKEYPKTCRYCALKSLCRVAETDATLVEEDEDEPSSAAEGANASFE